VTLTGYRELNEYEFAVLLRLLEAVRLPASSVWDQLRQCRVREISAYRDNYGSIEFDPDHSMCVPFEEVVIEAISRDRDGIPVEAILHARAHIVKELEFVKADGSPLIERPHPHTFAVSEHHRSWE
jgi:hypothetical protein